MLVKELKPHTLDGRKWVYHDSPVMSIDKQAAQKYDDSLEKMEKKYNICLENGKYPAACW